MSRARHIFPIAATLVAFFLRGGKTDRDGLFVADVAVGAAALLFAISSVLYATASMALDVSIIELQVFVLAAPLICLVGTVFGISKVFDLKRLSSVGIFQDVAIFLALLWAARWFMGKFWGWGLVRLESR